MNWILRATPNAPKSCTMQEMLGDNAIKLCQFVDILFFFLNMSSLFKIIISIDV